MNEVAYTFAGKHDLPAINALLKEAGLPPDGIETIIEHSIVARVGPRVVGSVSLEIEGRFALLRSLVVAPACRGRAIAQILVARITSYAQLQRVEQLFLLTTDAAGYFLKHGFVHADRARVPAEMRATDQFRSVCPSTAACLSRRLSGRAVYASRDLLRLQPDVPGARMWSVSLEQTMMTYFEVEPHCRFERHRHESEQITTVLSGALFFDVDGVVHRVKAGDAMAIPSGVLHAVWTEEQPATAMDAWSPVMTQYQPHEIERRV